jgi:hypothetical protein
MRLTFCTAADTNYEFFVLPYLCSALTFNRDARAEVYVEPSSEFKTVNAGALRILRRHFGKRFVIRHAIFEGRIPHVVRFLEEPEEKTEFTYIGDVDILLLEPISEVHIEHMARTGLPYSNILRPGSDPPRLSGLHFTRTDAFYPLKIPSYLDAKRDGDEATLAHLVCAKGLRLPDPADTFRPVHGFHFSLNRMPTARIGWGLQEKWIEPYQSLRNSAPWSALRPLFDRRYLLLLALAESVLHSRWPDQFNLDNTLSLKELLR